MPAYHRNDGNAVSKDVTVPGDVEKNRIFWLPLYVDQRLLYLYKEIVWKNHRRTAVSYTHLTLPTNREV